MSDRAATVIPLPLSVVESNIWDAASWPLFVSDLEWAERRAHERYLFGVRQGRRVYEIPVAVRWHPRDHRVSWRELSGPAWRGEVRLTAMNGRRTRVVMEACAHPRSFLGSIADMFGAAHRDVPGDLNRLADRLAQIPQPLNPARLRPSRQIVAARRSDAAPAGEAITGEAVTGEAIAEEVLVPVAVL